MKDILSSKTFSWKKSPAKYLSYTSKATCLSLMICGAANYLNATNPNHDTMAVAQQDSHRISGAIFDENGVPVIGANITVKNNPSIGTISDMDGKYTLMVPTGSILVISYIGYTPVEQMVGNKNTLDIHLQEDTQKLNEVVVVGYGTQKRKEITSSITSVKSEDFNKGATTNPLQLVQGKVAGLSITKQAGNDPNADLGIQLRGVSSAKAGTAPLVIVDGIPGANLHNIAQDDIESIDVLRDGSAAAIYGTRGTNGVIIITTKKGKAGHAKVEYNGYVSLETIHKKLRVLNTEEFRALKNEGYAIEDLGANTDWFDELTRNVSLSHYHNVSLTGGTDKFNYRASLNFRDLQPIVRNTDRQQYGGRINVNHRSLGDKLLIQLNLANTFTSENYTEYGMFAQAIQRPPTLPIMDPENPQLYHETAGWDYYNPVAYQNQFIDKGESRFLNADVKATLDIIPGLKASALLAMDRYENSRFNYLPSDARASILGGYKGAAERKENVSMNRMLETTIDYSLQNVENHSLSAVVGYSYQDFENHEFRGKNYDFTSDAFSYNNLGNGSYLKDGRAELSSNRNKSVLISFFGRVNYGFKDKYLFSASLRREGSSKFGPNNKWGWFPAVSAGWRISQEDFMSSVEFLNDLKVRVGYGVTGNQSFDPYQSMAKLADGGKYYDATTSAYISAFGQGNNPNPNLRWEKKHEWNIGLDASVLDSRISATIDVYKRQTKDLLFNYSAPKPPMIHDQILTNVGTMNNSGVEVALTFVPLKSSDFTWETTLSYSYNKNKLVSLSNSDYSSGYFEYGWISAPGNPGNAFRMEEGYPVANFYGYKYAGLTEDGKWLFEKKDGTVVTRNEIVPEDKQYIGNGAPNMFAGWTNTFRYKNWDLSIFFRGAFGFDICNVKEMVYGNKNFLPKNVLYSAITKHKDLNDDCVWSDYYLEKGDYIKLDNVTLGYTLDLNNKYLKNMRLYLTGQNLFTITSYSGVDPEVNQAGIEAGVDGQGYFPRTRQFSLGLNLVF